MIKNMRLAELKISIPTVFLNTKTLKMILIKCKDCVVTKIIKTSVPKS